MFGRLHRIAEPVFFGYELAPHHSEVEEWLEQGLFQHAGSADEIPGPSGETLAVTKTAIGWIGTDEDTGTTHTLEEREVATYRVSLPTLIDLIRARSKIVGTGFRRDDRLYPLGETVLPGGASGTVYLAFPTPREEVLLSACAVLEDSKTAVAVATMLPTARSPACQKKLDEWRIIAGHVDDSLRVRLFGDEDGERAEKKPEYGFLWEGATWRIHFLGLDFTAWDSRGMHLLALLLDDPSEPWTPLELEQGFRTADKIVREKEDGRITTPEIGADLESGDPRTLAICRREEARLEREVEIAEADKREVEKREAEAELEKFRRDNASTLGFSGRARLNGAKERARKNVRKLIETALAKITSRNERVGSYLRDRTRLAVPLSYTPDRDEVWKVRFPQKK